MQGVVEVYRCIEVYGTYDSLYGFCDVVREQLPYHPDLLLGEILRLHLHLGHHDDWMGLGYNSNVPRK